MAADRKALWLAAWLFWTPGVASGVAQAAAPISWLQDRMDRVTVAAGQEAEQKHVTLTDEEQLRLDQAAERIAVPSVLLAVAPSPEAVDGLLAVLLSYAVPLRPDDRRGPGTKVTLGNNSGAPDRSDNVRDRNGTTTTTTDAPPPPPDPAVLRKQRAWRGVGWYTRTRGCAAALVDYLRMIATGGSATVGVKTINWPASRAARDILNDLGSLAYPSGEQCRSRPDPAFEAAKVELAEKLKPSAAIVGPQFGP